MEEEEEEKPPSTGWTLQNEANIPVVELVRRRCAQAKDNPGEFFDFYLGLVEELRGKTEVLYLLRTAHLLTMEWRVHERVPRLQDIAKATGVPMERADWKFRVVEHPPARTWINGILDVLCAEVEQSVQFFTPTTESLPPELRSTILSFFDVSALRRNRVLFSLVNYAQVVEAELVHRRTRTLQQFRTSELVLQHINRILWDLANTRKEKQSIPFHIEQISRTIDLVMAQPPSQEEQLRGRLAALRAQKTKWENMLQEEPQLTDRLRIVLYGNPMLDEIASVHDAYGKMFSDPVELLVNVETTPLLLAMALNLGDVAIQLLENGADINFSAPVIVEEYAFDEVSVLALSVVVFFLQRQRAPPADHLYLRLLQGEDALWTAPDVDMRTAGRFRKVIGPGHMEDLGEGYTALHLAMLFKVVEVVRHLIAAGADVNLALTNGYTPLSMAAEQGGEFGLRMIVELTKAHADPNNRIADPEGARPRAHPLMVVLLDPGDIQSIDLNVLEALIAFPKMDLSFVLPDEGNILTILTEKLRAADAVMRGSLIRIITRLVDRGVDVNVPHTIPMLGTPLHSALSALEPELALRFLEAGADALALDAFHLTPLDRVKAMIEDREFMEIEFFELQAKLEDLTRAAGVTQQHHT